MAKKPEIAARVLSPSEYPSAITTRRGAYTPQVVFAAVHPLGLFHVEDEGAGHLGVFFTSRRSKHAKPIGGASSMAGAFRRISAHEDELIHPHAAREEGKHGPVSIFALGKRTGEPKPKSQLDHELDAWLAEHGYGTAGARMVKDLDPSATRNALGRRIRAELRGAKQSFTLDEIAQLVGASRQDTHDALSISLHGYVEMQGNKYRLL